MHNTPSSSTWARSESLPAENKKANMIPGLTNSSGTPSTPVLISSSYDPQRDANVPDPRVNASHVSGLVGDALPRSSVAPSVWDVVADSPLNAAAAAIAKTSPQLPRHIRGSEGGGERGSYAADWERGQTDRITSASTASALAGSVPGRVSHTPGGGASGSDAVIAYGAAAGTRKSQDTAQQRHEKLLLQQRNVYVSGLPPEFKAHELQALCEAFGSVDSVKLCMIDSASLPRESAVTPYGGRGSGKSTAEVDAVVAGSAKLSSTPRHEIIPACKGYGFVLFRECESATACIAALNNKILNGKPLQVRRADLTAAPPRKTASTTSMPLMHDRYNMDSSSSGGGGGGGGPALLDSTRASVPWRSVGGLSGPQFITQDAPSSALPSYAFGGCAPSSGAVLTQTSPAASAAPVHMITTAPPPPLYFSVPRQTSVPAPSSTNQNYLYNPLQFSAVSPGQPQNFSAPVMAANPSCGEYRMVYVPSVQSVPQHVSPSLSPIEQPQPALTGPISQLGGTPQVVYYFVTPNGQTYAVSGG